MSDRIILNHNAEPFGSEAAAKQERKRRELPAATHEIVKHGGGWAIQRPAENVPGVGTAEGVSRDPQAGPRPDPAPAAPLGPDRIYKKVMFSPKQAEIEQENVELWLNGTAHVYRRGEEVITTLALLEVADHTTRNVTHVRAGLGRKVVGKIKTFPYSVIGDATNEEYQAFRRRALAAATAANEAGAAA